MKNVYFIYNPSAGETVITEWLDSIILIHQNKGYSIIPYRLTFNEEEKESLLRRIDDSFHHILIAGGDGTVNYVVNVMKAQNVDIPIAILPTGTANDFSKMLGIPTDIEKACKLLLEGSIERVDLGRVNDEYFVNVFSCGLFTDISQKTPTFLKNTFGKLAYYFSGLTELPTFRKMNIKIESPQGSFDGSTLIFFVFNGRTAGQLRLAYLAEINDGLLDVLVVKGNNPINTFGALLHFLKLNTTGKYPAGIKHMKCSELTVYSAREEPTDIDGQAGPDFPIHITCEAGALQIIRPARRKK